MRGLVLLMMLFTAIPQMAKAESMLMHFNIATYATEEVCVDAYGWQAQYVEDSMCWQSTLQTDCNNMFAAQGCVGGTYYPNSNNCNGAQAYMNKHLENTCPDTRYFSLLHDQDFMRAVLDGRTPTSVLIKRHLMVMKAIKAFGPPHSEP